MQYVWQHGLWAAETDMNTVDGRAVEVINRGRLNSGPGPDFFNAVVKIDGQTWAGDIEIHVRATDWHRHGHDTDAAYGSVVLHVVAYDDGRIDLPGRPGQVIPQMLMTCSPRFRALYEGMVHNPAAALPCAAQLRSLPRLHVSDWLASLVAERLYERADKLLALLARHNGDWEQVCYITVARALGFGTNADPMERLAVSTPLRLLRKHADSLPIIEAILFGQAGLLDGPVSPEGERYVEGMRSNYRFMTAKFGLRPPGGLGWKIGGMRPANFPHRRIATLAALVAADFSMSQRLMEVQTDDDLRRIFEYRCSPWWRANSSFRGSNPVMFNDDASTPDPLSQNALNLLRINVLEPFRMARRISLGDEDALPRAIEALEDLPPERNSIITMFDAAGIKAESAATTQALLQLKRAYCDNRKCLYCRFGHRILACAARNTDPLAHPLMRP